MIALEQASLSRSGRHLLSDVTHALAPGRVTVLLGANGAGKTSLVRLLSGEWTPTAGRALWDGVPLARLPRETLARHRAVVSQHAPLAFPFRVEEVVLLGRLPHAQHPSRSDLDIAREALDLVGLSAFAARAYDTLSGGERQRVHLARALAQLHEARQRHSGVLLLDEPTAHLDLAQQQRALALARRLAGEGLAVLAVLHDLNLAAACADEVLLLCGGHLMAAGAPSGVLTCALLQAAFGVSVEVVRRPEGRPVFAPVSPVHPPSKEEMP